MTENNLKATVVATPPTLQPEQDKTPSAHTDYLPPSVFEDLAKQTGTPVAQLGKLLVRTCAGPLWSAIRMYASFSPVPPGHARAPLTVDMCAREKDEDGGDPNDDDEFHSMAFSRRRRLLNYANRNGSENEGRTRHGATVAPRPVVGLDTTTTALLWPPPPHLTAERLIKLRDANPRAVLQRVVLQTERDNAKSDGIEDGADANDVERDVVYLFYFHTGAGSNEMLLMSAGGDEPLLRFAEEILVWYTALKSAPDLHARFQLHRFRYEQWESEGLRRARPADSVVLVGDQMETILADVDNFLNDETRDWYFRHGLPYRRAFLFYGPPGTGKTSTVRVIASKFRLNCCVLSIPNNQFSNQGLGDALSSLPPHSVLVLEDVDALFNEDRSNRMESQLTFSGLLNALDGLVSVEGLITIMTTNFIDRLESALIRGGRVDRRFRFDLPTDDQLRKLFRSFYPKCAAELPDQFVKAVRSRREGDEARAVSTLQQLFIEMRQKSAEECISEMDKFFTQHFPPDDPSRRPSYLI